MTTEEKTDNELLLEIKNLKIEGQTGDEWIPIVKGVDVTLNHGEILGLIGESGAGKSTIGLASMGYAQPGLRITDGQILFHGEDLRDLRQRERRAMRGVKIAYVAQSAAASFNPAHKLIDQFTEIPVQHGVHPREVAEKDAIQLFTRLQMPDPDMIGFRYPHQVSGGQLQRAMTAMALSCRPDLIIFDEPTTALDVTTQIEVLVTIRDIVEEFNTAAIYITHDLAVVAQMADKITVLRYGKVVEEAKTRIMLSDPQENYTKSLWAVRSFKKTAELPERKTDPLCRVENVTAAYGDIPVLHDISFNLHKGYTVAIVGESGSGKSTAARVITGLLPPKQGQVFYKGEPLPLDYRRRTKDQLRQIQMIYQLPDTALNPRQKIRDVIGRPLSFYLGMNGVKKETRIRELLDMIELEPDEFIDRYPGELSGGQKQRICIARAVAAEPEFIICDEVTSALDQLVAEGILRLLDKLQQELSLAYMFITHDLATVKAIADRVVVMLQGKIVEQGDKKEVFSPPHPEYTKLLLTSVPEMDPDWLDNILDERKDLTIKSADQ